MQGNPGTLWTGDLSPWVMGSESAQRWVGRAGPRAQEAYFRRHRKSVIGIRVVVPAAAAAIVLTGLAIALR